jgi:hypothetical protein
MIENLPLIPINQIVEGVDIVNEQFLNINNDADRGEI